MRRTNHPLPAARSIAVLGSGDQRFTLSSVQFSIEWEHGIATLAFFRNLFCLEHVRLHPSSYSGTGSAVRPGRPPAGGESYPRWQDAAYIAGPQSAGGRPSVAAP